MYTDEQIDQLAEVLNRIKRALSESNSVFYSRSELDLLENLPETIRDMKKMVDDVVGVDVDYYRLVNKTEELQIQLQEAQEQIAKLRI